MPAMVGYLNHWATAAPIGHEKVPTRGKPGLQRPGRPRGERIVRQALVDLSDSFNDRSRPTRGLLATDHVILNHGQVTWTTPELAPPLLTTTPHQREDVSALDRFNVHRCPTRRVFSGTGLEPVTKQATVRYLYHLATAATDTLQKQILNPSTLSVHSL
ncbi:uncharacterized protein TNCV_1125471 [Trichonephila clavipes]|nr:uncharacterized protein TNCV_1125471 [Trichonephila clavipes]